VSGNRSRYGVPSPASQPKVAGLGGVPPRAATSTGTTLLAAIETGRNSIGVEIESTYVELIRQRLASSNVTGIAAPAIIQVALKSIWTEHGKARMNRLRDFNSFHAYAHQYSPDTVAGAFLVVNAAQYFLSPLNIGKTHRSELTTHPIPMDAFVKETVDRFRSIHLRNGPQDAPGLEALGVVIIEHDNIVRHPNPATYSAQCRPT
jgi:hypothetical protein